MKEHRTQNCLVCFKPAIVWVGHVHKYDQMVFAGWCAECKPQSAGMQFLCPPFIDCKNIEGCYGYLNEEKNGN